jgi:hypothetical protein
MNFMQNHTPRIILFIILGFAVLVIIEFTRYYAHGTDIDGYTQISDKELWSYNISSGELSFLQTISLQQ